jgi:hypothetical protein
MSLREELAWLDQTIDVEVITGQYLQTVVSDGSWWQRVRDIVKGNGCPSLDLDLLQDDIRLNPTYRLINVVANYRYGNVNKRGIIAFMLVKETPPYLEIEYGCVLKSLKQKKIMSTLVRRLQANWAGDIVADVIRSVEALTFWWRVDFRPRDRILGGIMARRLAVLALSDLRDIRSDSFAFVYSRQAPDETPQKRRGDGDDENDGKRVRRQRKYE